MTRIKVCGITNLDDALSAVDAGADALGFVFVPSTPRYLAMEAAAAIIQSLPPFVQTVGVIVDAGREHVNEVIRGTGIDAIQMHGQETPDDVIGFSVRVIKGIRVSDRSSLESLGAYDVSAYLLDTFVPGLHGGTGQTFDWNLAAEARRFGRVIVGGGLREENVAEAIRICRPYAVDVSSGVEESPGKKSAEKIRRFIQAVQAADLTNQEG